MLVQQLTGNTTDDAASDSTVVTSRLLQATCPTTCGMGSPLGPESIARASLVARRAEPARGAIGSARPEQAYSLGCAANEGVSHEHFSLQSAPLRRDCVGDQGEPSEITDGRAPSKTASVSLPGLADNS